MTTTVPVYEALILFSESNLPGFVLKAERCQNHNGSANGNFGDCGDSVVAIARGFSGEASLAELGGCDVVAVATLAVAVEPATTKARQYCRGGAAARSCSTR